MTFMSCRCHVNVMSMSCQCHVNVTSLHAVTPDLGPEVETRSQTTMRRWREGRRGHQHQSAMTIELSLSTLSWLLPRTAYHWTSSIHYLWRSRWSRSCKGARRPGWWADLPSWRRVAGRSSSLAGSGQGQIASIEYLWKSRFCRCPTKQRQHRYSWESLQTLCWSF